MSPATIVPAVDALPLPGPAWVFKALLLLTFLLHVIPMNLFLGGGLIAAVERLRGGPETPSGRMAERIGRMMPGLIAFTVTLGVAPLLFLQVLYGQFFYTSSVLIAWPWFLVVPTLIVIYYFAYAVSFRGRELGSAASALAWLVSLGAVGIAFVLVTNVSLSLRPESWAALYFASARGMHLNLTDPTMLPRYLHFLTGALAVGGLTLAWLGRRAEDVELSGHMERTGTVWFLAATGVQVLIGFWFLLRLPEPVLMLFMGRDLTGTISLWLGVIAALGALVTLAIALATDELRARVPHALGLLAATLAGMVLARDTVRDAMLAPHFRIESIVEDTQSGVLPLFLLTLAFGLVAVGWMIRALTGAGRRTG